MTVMDLLLAADAQAVNGVLYNGNTTKQDQGQQRLQRHQPGGKHLIAPRSSCGWRSTRRPAPGRLSLLDRAKGGTGRAG